MKKDCGQADERRGTTCTAMRQTTLAWSKGNFVWTLRVAD